jgi:hypothetical protein
MIPMKRLGLMVLVLALGGIFAVPSVLGGKPPKWLPVSITFKLAPPADAPEPHAFGVCTLDDWLASEEVVTVSCKGLTPGKQYSLVVLVLWTQCASPGHPIASGSYLEERTATADKRGRFEAECTVVQDWEHLLVRDVTDVWIENDAGGVVLVSTVTDFWE